MTSVGLFGNLTPSCLHFFSFLCCEGLQPPRPRATLPVSSLAIKYFFFRFARAVTVSIFSLSIFTLQQHWR